jgi:succinoglycan biosynthesis protein ExoM
MRVAVCIATYRRPTGLARLLEGLANLKFEDDSPEVRIVVADNDPEESARPVVEAFRAGSPFPVKYVTERTPGIAPARNASVAAAGQVDFLAFIDDDGVPDPSWLAELLRVQRDRGAPIVGGPGVPAFEHPPPSWVVRGRYFHWSRHKTGEEIEFLSTSNLLVGAAILPDRADPFPEKFGLTGGEDSHLVMTARRAGHKSVWCDEAVVTQFISPERASFRWMARRAFQIGNVSTHVEYDVGVRPDLGGGMRRLARAGLNTVSGSALALGGGLLLRRDLLVRGLLRIVRALGVVYALLGGWHYEYDRRRTPLARS